MIPKMARPLMLAAALLISLAPSNGQAGITLEGSWQGPFLEDFLLRLDFKKELEGGYAGTVLLSRDGAQLQNDPLAEVRMEGDSLRFFIPARETPFFGQINRERPAAISGCFIFPDGTRQPVFPEKMADPPDKGKLRAGLRPPGDWHGPDEKRYLPVELWYSDGKTWCIGSFTEEPMLPVGAEILSVNGQEMKQAGR